MDVFQIYMNGRSRERASQRVCVCLSETAYTYAEHSRREYDSFYKRYVLLTYINCDLSMFYPI